MTIIKTSNAVVPVESILYAERIGSCINIYIKGLPIPNNVVMEEYKNMVQAKEALEEISKKIENWG